MSDLHAADRIKAEAMSIFNDPPQETSQDVRDVIEWYHAQLRIELARAALSAPAVPPGFVLVPVEPTQAMCQEGQWKAQEWPKFPLRIVPIWKAMIAAAPSAKETQT